MAKRKFYVVWNGLKTGIFTSWSDCERQVKGVEGACYKSFDTREEAERAYASHPSEYIFRKTARGTRGKSSALHCPDSVKNSNAIAVDAACSGNPGLMEYRGVYLPNGQQLFHFGPTYGTNNIGEFLAIVHAMALIDKNKEWKGMAIYSDSRNAIKWVTEGKCKTRLVRDAQTEELYQLIARAEQWLATHLMRPSLFKWNTEEWGEIPADFGRK